VLVVTYMVGGLSAINAVAGAYSDDLPLLLISGKSSSNNFLEFDLTTMLHLT
jgi:pyruvate decarboxylase